MNGETKSKPAVEQGMIADGAKHTKKSKSVQAKQKKRSKKLSADQVRLNHITSEQRRRQLMRSSFDRLVQLVPELEPHESRSEIVIYSKTAQYLKRLYERNSQLRTQLREVQKTDLQLADNLIWEVPRTKDTK